MATTPTQLPDMPVDSRRVAPRPPRPAATSLRSKGNRLPAVRQLRDSRRSAWEVGDVTAPRRGPTFCWGSLKRRGGPLTPPTNCDGLVRPCEDRILVVPETAWVYALFPERFVGCSRAIVGEMQGFLCNEAPPLHTGPGRAANSFGGSCVLSTRFRCQVLYSTSYWVRLISRQFDIVTAERR
jgi:hypothetical protein